VTERRIEQIRMEGVTRVYGPTVALEEMDLEIQGGEFIALLGPSGCGKTTALNCLAGLVPLTDGAIHMDGRRIDHLPPEKRGFGMVFQNYALFPHLSVWKNVAFGLQMRRVAREEIRRRVREALELVQLEKQAGRLPAQLSGGQQQRVAIARALAFQPPLVLMDEPLSNLDASLRVLMRTEIRRIHQNLGLTTVYVTHDQQEALSLADRLVVLREGRVQQVGSPEEIYSQPASAYVAAFMGYRNLFEMPVAGHEGGRVTLEEAGLKLEGSNGQGDLSTSAVAAVRPEDFEVGPAGTNQVEVTVEVVEYQGRELSVEAVTASGRKLHFRTPARLHPGDRTTVHVAAERVLVFPKEELEP
jgi:putative spermidine/putrescine transport system ATP-binding protein